MCPILAHRWAPVRRAARNSTLARHEAGSAFTPTAACDRVCLVASEYTPLEPDGAEHKYPVPGIGTIMALNPKTGEPIIELVETLP